MNDTASRCAHKYARKRGGFTLIELMVVVTIVGVLAAVAYPSLESYIFKSRCTEATAFLGQIKLHQESFRSEFGQYVGSTAAGTVSNISFVPTPTTDGSTVIFNPASSADATFWQQLGARPDSAVRFGYGWASGTPANMPSNLGAPDVWFVSQAVGDVNADGRSITFEGYSGSTKIWAGDENGDTHARGWD